MPCIFAILKSTGLVAQGLEHRTHNPRVAGSIPARPTLVVKHTLTGVLFVFTRSIATLFESIFGVLTKELIIIGVASIEIIFSYQIADIAPIHFMIPKFTASRTF